MAPSLALTQLQPHQAAAMLAGAEQLDPCGAMRAPDVLAMCERSLCFEAKADAGQAVYVLHLQNRHVWIQAAIGAGDLDLTRSLLAEIEAQVAGAADSVAFQTKRRGLVRKSERHGYRCVGWIMKKDLHAVA